MTTKFSALTPVPSLDGSEIVPISTGNEVDGFESASTTTQAIADFVTGQSLPGAGYAQYLAASLEPDAIERVQTGGSFSYVVGPSETKLLLASWQTRIGTGGRMEQRDPQKFFALRDTTLAGTNTGSCAIILDPSLPVYDNPWQVYYERLQQIMELPTKNLPFSATNQKFPMLPGAYGAIITQYTCFDFAWLALRPAGGSTIGVNLSNEISDSATQRVGNSLSLAISKTCAGQVHSSSTGTSPSGSISFVLLPSDWSVIPDPVSASYSFRDDFMGSTLDLGVWTRGVSIAGNIEIDTFYQWLKLTGSNTWGQNGLYRTATESRVEGKTLVVDVYLPTDSPTGGSCIVGWSNAGGQSFANMAHGLNFGNLGNIEVYESSTNRGTVGTYTAGAVYRVKITLTATGATYEIQGGAQYPKIGGATWTAINPGVSSSAVTTLTPGAAAFRYVSYLSDFRVYSP